MRNNHILIALFFGILISNPILGQIIANNQNAYLGYNGGTVSLSEQVTLNGLAVDNSTVTYSLINASHTGITLNESNVVVSQGLDPGAYTATYQVCEMANPSNCSTAVITIQICYLNYLIINPINFHCGIGNAFEIQNLPWGNWTLTINGAYTIQGSGQQYTFYLMDYPQESYFFEVTDDFGCNLNSGGAISQHIVYIPLTIVPQSCDAPASSLTLTDLPEGNWVLNYRKANSQTITINGSGNTYTLTGLSHDFYYFTVWDLDSGCYSEEKVKLVGFLNTSLQGNISGVYNDFNNDGISNLGDIVQYSFSITNTTNCMMDVFNYSIEGASYTSGTFTNIPAGATVYGTLNYVLTQNNINQASVSNTLHINALGNGFSYIKNISNLNPVPLTVSDGIKLNAFIDTNNNGVQDNGEQNYTRGIFSYQINSGESHNVISSTGTYYLYETNPANTYTLHYNIPPSANYCGSQYTTVTPSYTAVTVANGTGIVTYHFAITMIPCTDIAVHLHSYLNRPIPGLTYTNTINYKNEGNQVIPSGSLTFTKDDLLSIINISESAATLTASGFTYDFTNLLPNETRFINVSMQVPTIPTIALGDLLTNTVTITPTDGYATNNTATLTRTIVGSYDPNDKSEAHGGKIVHPNFTADDYFTYTIRFENTGTAEAINVKVDDVLDAALDETSVRMIKASHNYVLDRVGSALSWRFDGIGLPPSVEGDEITGHGYIVFQVKPKPGFALGDVIPNTVNIYFDFNPAIVTNTCTTEFVPFLGVNTFENGSLDYYPNPTSGLVTFSMKNARIDQLEITDVLGKTLISKAIQNTETTFDLSSLKSGIYFAKLSSGANEKTVKVIKR